MSHKENSTHKTQRSIRWNLLAESLTLVIHVLASYVLHKLIPPEQFGIVILALSVTILGTLIWSLELGQLIVREDDMNHQNLSSIFWAGMAMGVLIFVIFFVFAGHLSNLFKTPELKLPIQILSLAFLIQPLGLVSGSLLRKHLKYGTISLISLSVKTVCVLTAIYLATKGNYIVSLIVLWGVPAPLTSILHLIANPWFPKAAFSFNYLKKNLPLSGSLLFNSFTTYLVTNLDIQLLSATWGNHLQSHYSKSAAVAKMPQGYLAGAIANVVFPSLSISRDDQHQSQLNFTETIRLMGFILFPIFLVIIALARPFVAIYFSDDWDLVQLEWLMRVFCLAGMFAVFNPMYLSLMKSKSTPKYIFKMITWKRSIMLVAILVTFKIGIMAVAVGRLVSELISFIINMIIGKTELHLSIRKTIRKLLPSLLNAAISASISYLLFRLIDPLFAKPLLPFLITGIITIALYFLLALGLDKEGLKTFRLYFLSKHSDLG